jgi:hypothetical protein
MKRIKEKGNTRVYASVRPRENDNHDDDDDDELQNRTNKKGSLSPNDSPRHRDRHNLLFLILTTNEETPRPKLQTPQILLSQIRSLNFLLEDEFGGGWVGGGAGPSGG